MTGACAATAAREGWRCRASAGGVVYGWKTANLGLTVMTLRNRMPPSRSSASPRTSAPSGRNRLTSTTGGGDYPSMIPKARTEDGAAARGGDRGGPDRSRAGRKARAGKVRRSGADAFSAYRARGVQGLRHRSRRILAVNCRRLTVLAAAAAAVLVLAAQYDPGPCRRDLREHHRHGHLPAHVHHRHPGGRRPDLPQRVPGGLRLRPRQRDRPAAGPGERRQDAHAADDAHDLELGSTRTRRTCRWASRRSRTATARRRSSSACRSSARGLKSVANGGHLDFTLSVMKGQPDPTFTLDAARTGITGLQIVELNPPPRRSRRRRRTPPAAPRPRRRPRPMRAPPSRCRCCCSGRA